MVPARSGLRASTVPMSAIFNGLPTDVTWPFMAERKEIRTSLSIDCDPASMLCGIPKRVTSGIRAEVPSWSADGGFLYFASDRTERSEVWKQATSGGQPVQVTQNGGYAARESRDGKWLYFSKNRSEAIWRMPVARSGRQAVSAEELVIGPPNHVQQKGWTLIPDGIIFTERARGGQSSALRAYQFSSKRTRLIVPFRRGLKGTGSTAYRSHRTRNGFYIHSSTDPAVTSWWPTSLRASPYKLLSYGSESSPF